MKKNRINVSPVHRDILVEEFDTTRQTVFCALRYFTESDLAKQIRKRAKELLIEEAEGVEGLPA